MRLMGTIWSSSTKSDIYIYFFNIAHHISLLLLLCRFSVIQRNSWNFDVSHLALLTENCLEWYTSTQSNNLSPIFPKLLARKMSFFSLETISASLNSEVWTQGNSALHREIMPLRITVAYDTLCHGGICQSGESRISGPLYTVAIEISNTLCQMIWSSSTTGNVSCVTLLYIEHVERTCSAGPFAMLSRPSFDFHLPQGTKAYSFSSRHGGRCHCGHEVPHALDIQSGIFSLCIYRIRNTACDYQHTLQRILHVLWGEKKSRCEDIISLPSITERPPSIGGHYCSTKRSNLSKTRL